MIAVASLSATPHIERAHSAMKKRRTEFGKRSDLSIRWEILMRFTNQAELSCIWTSPRGYCPEFRSMRIPMLPFEWAYCWDFHWWTLLHSYCDTQRIWIVIVRPSSDSFYNRFRIFGMRPVASTGIRAVNCPRSKCTHHLGLEIYNPISNLIHSEMNSLGAETIRNKKSI